jgi:signal transduction histidine kinase
VRDAGDLAIARSLLDHAPVGMALVGSAGTLLWVNAAFAGLARTEPDALTGRGLDDLGDAAEGLATALRELLAQGPGHILERRWAPPGEPARWLSLRVSAALAADGAPLRVEGEERPLILQAVDVTSRKQAESDAAAAHELLRVRNRALERSNEDLTQFAYVASHDLSEPLRVISGHVELLAAKYQGRLDETADRYIAFAVDGCERMRALIDALLAYSRIGRHEARRTPVPLADVVAQVARDLAPALAERGGVVEPAPDLATVDADPVLLAQVLANLVGNAVKFSPEGTAPVVRVTAHRDGDAWVIGVHDNGAGIPEEQRDRVFRLFQRLHRREVPGTGIGLAAVRRAAEQHGGTAWIGTSGEGGTTVWVSIPDATEAEAP